MSFLQDDNALEREKANIKLLFNRIDTDNSGHISKEEFVSAIKHSKIVKKFVNESQVLRLLVARKDFASAFAKMDSDASDEVTFDEFWKFCQEESDKRNIQRLFKAIDKDGSKKITADEFKWAFRNNEQVRDFFRRSHLLAPLLHRDREGNEDWDSAFAAIDDDEAGSRGHGKIDIHEFFNFCKRMAAKEHTKRLKRLAAEQKLRQQRKKERMMRDRVDQHVMHIARPGRGGSFTVSVWPSSNAIS